MTFAAHSNIVRSLALAGLVLLLSACTGSGEGSNNAAPASAVTVTGTVGGTRIVAVNDNDHIVAEDDTAGRVPSTPGRFPFTLANLPVGSNLRLFFISNGSLFPFYLGGTNVIAFNNAGPVNLGFVTMDTGTGRATPELPPQNVTPKPENSNVPPGLIPGSSPQVSITSPAAGASVSVGPVTVAFSVQHHTIGNPGNSHLHMYWIMTPLPITSMEAPGSMKTTGSSTTESIRTLFTGNRRPRSTSSDFRLPLTASVWS
jgi:hypothetical protein